MIFRRFITYLTTPCPGYVRQMGYLSEVINIRERHRRCRDNWSPHLEKTREFVADTAQGCRKRGKAVVLGSGLLLDLPLDRLASRFDEVVLVDVLHLPEVLRRVSRFRNVRFLRCDVTGVAGPLWESAKEGTAVLPRGEPTIPEVDDGTALVVSLNILSQISVMPSRFAERKMKNLDEAALALWCDGIRSAHYSLLTSLPCEVCLVTDYRRAWRDRKGVILEERSTVGSLVLPEPDVSWTWEIAPLGEASPHCSKELRVGAWRMSPSRHETVTSDE